MTNWSFFKFFVIKDLTVAHKGDISHPKRLVRLIIISINGKPIKPEDYTLLW